MFKSPIILQQPQMTGSKLRAQMMAKVCCLAAVFFTTASLVLAEETKKVAPPAEDKKERVLIKPGDILELSAEEDSNFDGKYLVRPKGYIVVPRTGQVQVSGMELREAETVVANAINKRLKRAKTTIRMKNLGPLKNLPPDLPPDKRDIFPVT
jgi:protein involved in polysaccharide export with SLBB domain